MYTCDATNKLSPLRSSLSLFSGKGEKGSAIQLRKKQPVLSKQTVLSNRAKMEKILLPCVELLMPFLALKEINSIGLTNQTWRQKILAEDPKRQPLYIDRRRSLLIYLYVQRLLRNSEANPMTSARLLELAKMGKSLDCTILPFSSTHHFTLTQEDYMRNIRLQTAIKHAPPWHPYVHMAVKKFSAPVLSHYKQAIDDQIEGHGLAQLKNFTSLRNLTLKGPFNDAELVFPECLAGTLERLNMISLFITDVGLKNLAPLSTLKKLTLCTPRITDEGLHALGHLAQLQSLKFVHCRDITTTRVASLAHSLSLTSLSFIECNLHDINGVENFTKLRNLALRNCFRIADEHLGPLKKLQCLQHLNLSVCKEITEQGLAKLSGHPKLQSLNLDFTAVEEGGLYELWKNHFPALKAVSRKRPYYYLHSIQRPSDIIYVGEGLYVKINPVDVKTINLWQEYFLLMDKNHSYLIGSL